MQVSLWTHRMQKSYKKEKYNCLENLMSKKEKKTSKIKFSRKSDEINWHTFRFLLHKEDDVIFAVLKLSLTRHSGNVKFVKCCYVSVEIEIAFQLFIKNDYFIIFCLVFMKIKLCLCVWKSYIS